MSLQVSEVVPASLSTCWVSAPVQGHSDPSRSRDSSGSSSRTRVSPRFRPVGFSLPLNARDQGTHSAPRSSFISWPPPCLQLCGLQHGTSDQWLGPIIRSSYSSETGSRNLFCALFMVDPHDSKTENYTQDKGFPDGSDNNESAWNAGDLGLIPWLGRSSGGGHGNPLQYSCLENPHGQRSLVGCGPWGCKDLDMTEWLSTQAHTRQESFPWRIQTPLGP